MDFAGAIKTKYPYLSTDNCTSIANKAKYFYYSILYSSDMEVDEATNPITGTRAEQWVLAACDEIVERLGISSAVAFRENGVNWSFDNAQLSLSLMGMLKPTIGVMR